MFYLVIPILLLSMLAPSGAVLAAPGSFPIASKGQAEAVIVLPARPKPEEKSAAAELAATLGKMTGAAFRTAAEDSAPAGRQIHVGWTRQALEAVGPPDKTGLDDDGILLRTAGGDRLFLLGRNPWGTEFAVYRFLYRFGGVRWYMPTEIGVEVPSRPTFAVPAPLDVAENPDWLSRQWSAADRADGGEWNKHNLMRARYSFHHYLNVWMQPALFDAHPDWFPLRPDGKRYQPREKDDSWQPCMSNPAVADYVAGRILETFEKNPATKSASIGVNDSGWQGYCQCDGCKALDVPGKMSLHGGPDYSNRFFTFANRVAEKVAVKFPDHSLGCLAYNACENPPTFKVHPMIVPFLTNDRAQWRDRQFARADREWVAAWRAVCPSVSTYTYEYGAGYIIPRVYPRLQKEYTQFLKERGIKGWYAEIYCNWALDGPKAWLGSQLLWDSDQSVQALLDDFYGGFFGPARKPMQRYFDLCEQQWMRQPGKAVWFRYFFDGNQLELFPPDVCRRARQYLDEAARLATADPYRTRVELTSKAFHMTELYATAFHSSRMAQGVAGAADAEKAAESLLVGMRADQERRTYMTDVMDKHPLLKPVISFDERATLAVQAASPELLWHLLKWCRDNRREDLADRLATGLARQDPAGEAAAVVATMRRLPSPDVKDLIANGAFAPAADAKANNTGVDWKAEGAPPGWHYWERTPGAGKLRWVSDKGEQFVTLTAVKGACYIQTPRVKPGSVYLVLADYRGHIGSTSKATVTMSWHDAKGGWLDGARRTTELPRADVPGWRTTAVAGRAPEGAATAVIMLFADDQSDADHVAFDNVRMYEATR